MPETVKLRVVISIDVNDRVDTGLAVDEWNALSDADRQRISGGIWDSLATHDDGGTWVDTPGAVEI